MHYKALTAFLLSTGLNKVECRHDKNRICKS